MCGPFRTLLLWGKRKGERKGRKKEPIWEAAADPREQWRWFDHGGVSGHRRKQMYLGYILETELADFVSALNPEGSRVRQWKKPRMPSWVSDLSN